jgi:HEAT repeat protein
VNHGPVIEEHGDMSTSTVGDGDSQPESSLAKVRQVRFQRTGMRALIMLVLCCAAIFWAWRVVWEDRHPMWAAARRLRSAEASERLAAVQEVSELGTSGTDEAIGPLIPALADRDAAVRRAAAQALGNVGSSAAKSGTQAEVVREAAQGLLGALKDPEASVRIAAAGSLRILAGITPGNSSRGGGRGRGAKAAQEAESQPSVIDKAAVVAALLDLLGDRDPEVRQAALFALGPVAPSVLGEPPKALVAALEDESAANRAVAIGTMAAFQRGLDPFVASLLRHLANDERPVREACSRALARIRPAALTSAVAPALIEGLGNHDPDVRLRMVSLLSRISPDAHTAVPALIAVLNEPIDSDQASMEGVNAVTTFTGPAHEAAKALGRLAPGTPAAGQAIAALTKIVQAGPPQRRASAAGALGQFGKDAAVAVPALVSILGETEAGKEPTDEKASAAEALGRISPGTSSADQAVTALIATLKSQSTATRRAALEALPSFGPAAAGAIPQIRAVNESDPNPTVRKAAASALEKLEDGEKSPAPRSNH